jgi:hypothetical protein
MACHRASLDNQLLWRKKAMGLLRTAAVVKVASNRGAKKEAEKQEKEKAAEASKK